jgi:hypothetical protein
MEARRTGTHRSGSLSHRVEHSSNIFFYLSPVFQNMFMLQFYFSLVASFVLILSPSPIPVPHALSCPATPRRAQRRLPLAPLSCRSKEIARRAPADHRRARQTRIGLPPRPMPRPHRSRFTPLRIMTLLKLWPPRHNRVCSPSDHSRLSMNNDLYSIHSRHLRTGRWW